MIFDVKFTDAFEAGFYTAYDMFVINYKLCLLHSKTPKTWSFFIKYFFYDFYKIMFMIILYILLIGILFGSVTGTRNQVFPKFLGFLKFSTHKSLCHEF